MIVTLEKKDKIDIISFSVNRINALISDEIRDEIIRMFDKSNLNVIIDLKGIQYIDSTGFGCFLSIMKAARNSYSVLKFTNPEPQLTELFETLHLNTVFQIYPDMDACLKSFKLL